MLVASFGAVSSALGLGSIGSFVVLELCEGPGEARCYWGRAQEEVGQGGGEGGGKGERGGEGGGAGGGGVKH